VKVVPGLEREFAPLAKLDPGADDLLLFHYSAYAPRLEEQLARPQRKVLVFHNITPAEWFWDVEPLTAVECAIGREHLPRYARAAELAIGVSQFNADELQAAGAARTAVVANLVDPGALGPAGAEPDGSPHWLFVGRLVPHKRPDLLIRALALHRAQHDDGARLTWVGQPISPPYAQALREYAERVAPGAVSFEQDLSREALAERWRSAHVFACLSEHEGFCIPVLEAFHFGVPVVARAAGAVTEVAGDAGLLLEAGDDLATASEALHLAATAPGLRAELRARGRARLAAYAFEATAARLRAQLEAVAQ
jgi:glycosyltransferase involved in cell wall biosynthesis